MDREKAAVLGDSMTGACRWNEWQVETVLAGKGDDCLFVQAFALHRIEATRHDSQRIAELEGENVRLREALTRLRDCDWVITPLDRMDAVREIAARALDPKVGG
jgi:hypothetical protein